jgi:hypothetical protein
VQYGYPAIALLLQVGQVDGDHERGLIVHHRGPGVVQDLPAYRWHDHVLGQFLFGLAGIRSARHHLHEPEPCAESDQQRRHHEMQYGEAPP